MTAFPRNAAAAFLAGGTSLALLLGAFASQYWGGLIPCEMCVWQRWPHGIAAAIGLIGGGLVVAKILPRQLGLLIALVAIAGLAASGAIGVFHAGVEWKLWQGPTECTGTGYMPGSPGFGDFKLVRCDVAQWRLFGISLAGYNALFSLGAALVSLVLLSRKSADA